MRSNLYNNAVQQQKLGQIYCWTFPLAHRTQRNFKDCTLALGALLGNTLLPNKLVLSHILSVYTVFLRAKILVFAVQSREVSFQLSSNRAKYENVFKKQEAERKAANIWKKIFLKCMNPALLVKVNRPKYI